MDSFGGFPLHVLAKDIQAKRARIANPAGRPEQFQCKRGDFHARLFPESKYGLSWDPGNFRKRSQKHLPALTRGQNGAGSYSAGR